MLGLMQKRWIRATLVLAGVSILVPSVLCWHFRIYSRSDYHLHQFWRYSPAAMALWHGGLNAGEDVASLIAVATPHRTKSLGPFTIYHYYPRAPRPDDDGLHLAEVQVTAKHGRLFAASMWTCTGKRTCFDILTAEDHEEMEQLWQRASRPP
jgi:hypothetical protein